MGKLIDLTGQRFGRLVVIERIGLNKNKKATWLCRCDCGNEIVAISNSLRTGNTTSCGCAQRDIAREMHQTHNCSRQTRLYRIWIAMKQRCYYHRSNHYKDYGGRGITICDEWLHDFVAFRDWAMSHGYADDLSIDRIDNDKGYNPDNCRWATMKEQRHNRRDSK